jgi:L-ascorbate metabolism protein UlaG (beta-lactamase superfamily)
MLVLIVIIIAFVLSSCCAKNLDEARIQASPNFVGGKAKNTVETPMMTGESDESNFSSLLKLFTSEGKPEIVPSVKTDLNALDIKEEIMVWFGHSSFLLQTGGKRVLVDPVLSEAGAPVPFVNTPFNGTKIYEPDDIPAVDFLIITHDHYDHFSKKTLKAIENRVGIVICPLGVGKYLKKWGYPESKIVEMDWNEEYQLAPDFTIHCLTARHFSGRGLLSQNTTLWAAYLLQTPEYRIYFSGDSGYGEHFKEVGRRFGKVDLAFLENGQYDPRWALIHMMPGEALAAAEDMNALYLMPIHNSKFLLSAHKWNDPLIQITALKDDENLILMTPMIGEKVPLWEEEYTFKPWWLE